MVYIKLLISLSLHLKFIDDMESSKCHEKLLLVISILKYFTYRPFRCPDKFLLVQKCIYKRGFTNACPSNKGNLLGTRICLRLGEARWYISRHSCTQISIFNNFKNTVDKRLRSINRYCNMAPRFSGQTYIFGVVFFISKSLLGIKRQQKL